MRGRQVPHDQKLRVLAGDCRSPQAAPMAQRYGVASGWHLSDSPLHPLSMTERIHHVLSCWAPPPHWRCPGLRFCWMQSNAHCCRASSAVTRDCHGAEGPLRNCAPLTSKLLSGACWSVVTCHDAYTCRTPGALAEKCHAFAKALHYKELEFGSALI